MLFSVVTILYNRILQHWPTGKYYNGFMSGVRVLEISASRVIRDGKGAFYVRCSLTEGHLREDRELKAGVLRTESEGTEPGKGHGGSSLVVWILTYE